METSNSRTVIILVSIFALMVLSFSIVRTSLNLMNQRSDWSLILGLSGLAAVLLSWGLLSVKLIKIMGCKK